MTKYYLEKGPKVVKQKEEKVIDDEEKFLRESFSMGSDISTIK